MSQPSSGSAESPRGALVDPFGRRVKSLRASVTQRCDLTCAHCHREGQRFAADEMTPTEIEKIIRVASSLGIGKVKITGGEPLLREDIVDIVRRISPLLREVSLTTNGTMLSEFAVPLKSAGLTRVNVSLHTLDQVTYGRLCGPGQLVDVIHGIESAVDAGLNPVKVNMVVFRHENDGEITEMMEFCGKKGAILQLIEYEANRLDSGTEAFSARYYPLKEVEEALAHRALAISVNELHRRRRFLVQANGSRVEVEIVRPMHNTEFCSCCTRLRLTSDGKLKPCLLDAGGEVDVLSAARSGAPDTQLRELFEKAVANRKPYWS